MPTAIDIVARAYRKIGHLGSGETLSADLGASGIEQLNSMMFSWKLYGIDTEHTALAHNDAFPLDPEFEEPTVYLLGARLAAEMGLQINYTTREHLDALQAAFMVVEPATLDRSLTVPASRRELWYR